MANRLYGQNEVDLALDYAANSKEHSFGQVTVAGNNTQYGATGSGNQMAKSDCNKWFVNGHTNGLDMWLPSIDASDAGLWVGIRCGVASGGASIVVTASTGDYLKGHAFITKASDAVANRVYFASDGTDLIYTLNGTTTGGLIGTQVVFTANKDGHWTVIGDGNGSSTLATPFS